MDCISHRDLIHQLALRRLARVDREAPFAAMEQAIFHLEARAALDYDMLKAVLVPYANTVLDLDEQDGPRENDAGFDVLDLVIDTVCPEVFVELEDLVPAESIPEKEAEMAWEQYWAFKKAVFFAILEFHFCIFDATSLELD